MNKAERTKQFIVEKTAPLFNKKGFAGTSLSDITDATGLTKGSIYGNFSNKDEVALAVFDYNWQQVETIISAEMSKRVTAKDKLMVYADIYVNFLKHPFPSGGCPLLNTATEADDSHPQLRERAATAIGNWKSKIVKLINKGIADKEFRKGTAAEETALTLIALIEGGIMITKLTGKINYQHAITRSVKKLIEGLE